MSAKEQMQKQQEPKKKKFNFSGLFENNRFLKILSILIAIITWFLIIATVDPNTYSTISNVPVSVDLSGTIAESSGLTVLNTDVQYIDVRVRGKAFYVGRLGPDDFSATVNLTSVTAPGTYSLEVRVEAKESNNDNYEIVSTTPSTIELSFDRLATKTFEPEASAPNVTAAEGYIIDQYTVSPGELTISGPENKVNQIAKCIVQNTEKLQINSSSVLDGTLVLQDSNGNEIDQEYLQFSSEDLRITIPLYQKTTLPLTFDYINVPSGIDTSEISYTIEPADELNVAIPVDAAAGVESLSLGEVDFRMVDLGKTISMDVSLLAGYLNLDDITTVNITFGSEGMSSTYLSCENIVLKNVPSNYNAELLSSRISDIKFVGNADDIAALTSSDIVATVDFSKLGSITPGQQRLEALISVVDGSQAWAVGKKSVLVSIEETE